MNDPQRLLDSDPEARALLQAALAEEPSAAATAQLHAALGLTPRGAPLDAALDAPPAPLATPTAPLLASKWLVVTTVAIVAGYGAYRLRPAHDASPPPARELHERLAVAPAPRDGLGDELRRLDVARAALAQRAPAQSLAALEAYDALYPRGALREEALALRIDTLRALGRVEPARALARAFLRTYPQSVHRAHVQAELDDAR